MLMMAIVCLIIFVTVPSPNALVDLYVTGFAPQIIVFILQVFLLWLFRARITPKDPSRRFRFFEFKSSFWFTSHAVSRAGPKLQQCRICARNRWLPRRRKFQFLEPQETWKQRHEMTKHGAKPLLYCKQPLHQNEEGSFFILCFALRSAESSFRIVRQIEPNANSDQNATNRGDQRPIRVTARKTPVLYRSKRGHTKGKQTRHPLARSAWLHLLVGHEQKITSRLREMQRGMKSQPNSNPQ